MCRRAQDPTQHNHQRSAHQRELAPEAVADDADDDLAEDGADEEGVGDAGFDGGGVVFGIEGGEDDLGRVEWRKGGARTGC